MSQNCVAFGVDAPLPPEVRMPPPFYPVAPKDSPVMIMTVARQNRVKQRRRELHFTCSHPVTFSLSRRVPVARWPLRHFEASTTSRHHSRFLASRMHVTTPSSSLSIDQCLSTTFSLVLFLYFPPHNMMSHARGSVFPVT